MGTKQGVTRRQVLWGGAAITATACGGAVEPAAEEDEEGLDSVAEPLSRSSTAGLVVEISHPDVMLAGQAQAGPVRQMMSRGMRELTGRATERAAWSALFCAADVVGIKVSPVGYPEVYSHVETVLEIIRGLNLAGVPNASIIIFDRYKNYLDAMGYAAHLPKGVRLESTVLAYTDDQTGIGGYDPNHYVDIARVYPGDDPKDPHKRRSYLSRIVSTHVTKVVNVPALKDHVSAGLTLALKNMTYGCVNNVSRTHYAPANWTKDFVPAIAAMPALRDKVVLHVADALVACYDGGPGPPDPTFKTFPHGTLLFTTDPVAMDRIGWKILDAQRHKVGLPPLAECGLLLKNPGLEAFNERQPQHVLTAGAAGLGIAQLSKIRHRVVAL